MIAIITIYFNIRILLFIVILKTGLDVKQNMSSLYKNLLYVYFAIHNVHFDHISNENDESNTFSKLYYTAHLSAPIRSFTLMLNWSVFAMAIVNKISMMNVLNIDQSLSVCCLAFDFVAVWWEMSTGSKPSFWRIARKYLNKQVRFMYIWWKFIIFACDLVLFSAVYFVLAFDFLWFDE